MTAPRNCKNSRDLDTTAGCCPGPSFWPCEGARVPAWARTRVCVHIRARLRVAVGTRARAARLCLRPSVRLLVSLRALGACGSLFVAGGAPWPWVPPVRGYALAGGAPWPGVPAVHPAAGSLCPGLV